MDTLRSVLNEFERKGVDEYIARRIVPFVQECGSEAAVLGTGTVMLLNGRLFIVTAKHILRETTADQVGIAALERGDHPAFLTLDGCKTYYWPDDSLDVCVIEVLPPELRAAVERTYLAIGVETLGNPGASYDEYIVAGFPRSEALSGPGRLAPKAIKVTSTPFSGDLPQDADPQRDFFLCYAADGTDARGEVKPSVKLNGVSGASVWAVPKFRDPEGIWQHTDAIRVVGLQVAYKRTEYIRCHYWWLVARILEQVDPALGALCMKALEVR